MNKKASKKITSQNGANPAAPGFLHLGYAPPPPIRKPRSPRDSGDSYGPAPQDRVAVDSHQEAPKPRAAKEMPSWHPDGTTAGRMPFAPGEAEPILQMGEGHLMTIAPTGAGKGVCAVIPNLLNYTGSVVAIDPKGELCAVTADRRRKMGQRIVIFDPLGYVAPGRSDGFNPLEVIWTRGRVLLEDEAQKLADLICGERAITKEPFWDNWGSALMKGDILYLGELPAEQRNIGKLYDLLHSDDIVYNHAVMLDTKGKQMNRVGKQEIASFLQLTDVTRSGVLSAAQQFLKKFGSPQIRKVLEKTTFPVEELIDGQPMTIYIVLPPEYLKSHGAILRLWITALMKLFFARRTRPENNTLFLIDEAAQLGYMEDLEVAMTLARSYGVQVWSFWQSLSQLRRYYPNSWETLLDNTAILQMFGAKNQRLRNEFAALSGWDREEVADLSPEEQLLIVEGEPRRCWLPNYLRDPAYEGLAAPNPLFEKYGPEPGL